MPKIYFTNLENRAVAHTVIELAESLQLEMKPPLYLWARAELDLLKSRWNMANTGFVDIEDLDVLYDCLKQSIKALDKAAARAYQIRREQEVKACINGTWETV